MSLGPAEILVILVIALLIFGPTRLPQVARQVGRTMREFKRFQQTMHRDISEAFSDDDDVTDVAHAAEPAPSLPPKAHPPVEAAQPPVEAAQPPGEPVAAAPGEPVQSVAEESSSGSVEPVDPEQATPKSNGNGRAAPKPPETPPPAPPQAPGSDG